DQTSRTFALAIPLLPEPTRTTVKLSYLLFRIADTLEDAEACPRAHRVQALSDFCELLANPSHAAARKLSRRWLADPAPTANAHYMRLLTEMPQVLEEVAA